MYHDDEGTLQHMELNTTFQRNTGMVFIIPRWNVSRVDLLIPKNAQYIQDHAQNSPCVLK